MLALQLVLGAEMAVVKETALAGSCFLKSVSLERLMQVLLGSAKRGACSSSCWLRCLCGGWCFSDGTSVSVVAGAGFLIFFKKQPERVRDAVVQQPKRIVSQRLHTVGCHSVRHSKKLELWASDDTIY